MTQKRVLVLASVETKAEETGFFVRQLAGYGVETAVVDLSLDTNGRVLDGSDKLARMEQVVQRATAQTNDLYRDRLDVVVGLGGGTGGEIALQVMRSLPATFPKVLVSTIPFDPRKVAADDAVIFVPTLADLSGLNDVLCDILENAAAMTAGLCVVSRRSGNRMGGRSVAITALGATDQAVGALVTALRDRDQTSTVFHSNGFGGAALCRFAAEGRFRAIVDLTPHELTRTHLAGAFVPMPDRFTCGAGLPKIVLPGALNFLGLGPLDQLTPDQSARPHYAHSSHFTHVGLTSDEMTQMGARLAQHLNDHDGPAGMIVPMGGFSHQDKPDGALHDPGLRQTFLGAVEDNLRPNIALTVLPDHLFSPSVTSAILDMLDALDPS